MRTAIFLVALVAGTNAFDLFSLFGNGNAGSAVSDLVGGNSGGSDTPPADEAPSAGEGDCLNEKFGSSMSQLPQSNFPGAPDLNSQFDFCRSREEPEAGKPEVGWDQLQSFMTDPERAIKDQVKENACKKQIEDEKKQCDQMKEVMCEILSTGKLDLNSLKDKVCEQQKNNIGQNACKEFTDAILGDFNADQITGSIQGTATNAIATDLICKNLDLDSLSSGSSNGGGAEALGNLGQSAGGLNALSNLFANGALSRSRRHVLHQ